MEISVPFFKIDSWSSFLKKSFVFKEKTYPCTIKEETNLFSELTDLLITKKEQFGKAVESTDDSTGDNVDDGEAPSPDIEDDELEKASDMAKQRYQKFGYEDSDVTGQALPENSDDEDIPPHTDIQESVEYHDRESMPSAVDDAADVMSSYTKFLKSTKTYY